MLERRIRQAPFPTVKSLDSLDLGQSLSRPSSPRRVVSDTPQLLLVYHLKALKLPT